LFLHQYSVYIGQQYPVKHIYVILHISKKELMIILTLKIFNQVK